MNRKALNQRKREFEAYVRKEGLWPTEDKVQHKTPFQKWLEEQTEA